MQALADLHLHHVARGNVFLAARHGSQIVGLVELAFHRIAGAALDRWRGDAVAQLVAEFAQTALAVEVGLGAGWVSVDNEVKAARQVVDDGQFFALQQQDVRRVDAACLPGLGQARLDVAHRVVAEVARQPATKARQPRAQRHLETLLVLRDEVQRIAFHTLHHCAVGDDFGDKAVGPQQRARGQADEGIAPKTLPTHHAFQQEAVVRAAGQFEVQRQRCFEVRKGLGDERDAVEALRGKALEFKFGDHFDALCARRASQGSGHIQLVSQAQGPDGRARPKRLRLVGASDARARLPGRVDQPGGLRWGRR